MKGRSICFGLLIVAAALLNSVECPAQGIGDRNRAADGGDGQFGLQGRVYLPNGKPAVNARVSISSADTLPKTASTDLNGMFQVGSLRAGNYSVTVRAEGFPTEQEIVIIDRFAPIGRTFSVVINLQPEPPGPAAVSKDPRLEGIPGPAAEKFRRGIERLAQKDTKAGIVFFDEAIALHPAFAVAHYEKGTAYLKENSLDKALEAFVKAIEINPNYLEAKYSVGYTHYLKKNYEVAAAVFADVLKQKRDFAEAFLHLGISLYYLKNVTAAETALKAAVSLKDDASTALAHRFLGGMYMQANRKTEAAAELQKYLDLVPSAPDAARLKTTIEDLKKRS